MSNFRNIALAGASTIILSSLAAGSALAEDAMPAQPQSVTVPEIVVTAQKREQSLQKVPMAVTAITSQTLTQAGVVDMQGVSAMVPALTTETTNGSQSQSYRIRGVGSDPNTPTFEPDVALFIDGVYLPRSGLSVDDLVDIARVEVLEGPQSTLYGKNATAGVINIVTKGPSHHFEGSIEGSVSELDSSKKALVDRIAASVTGPINDHMRARLSVVTYNQQDSVKNLEPGAPDANGMHRYAVRGEVEADLWADTTLRVAAMRSEVYRSRTGQPSMMMYTFSPPNNAAKLDYSPLGSLFHITPCPDNNPSDRVTCTTSPSTLNTFSNVLSATLNSKIGRNTLTSITALSDYGSKLTNNDVAQVLLPVVNYTDVQKGGTFSEELRLTSPTGEKLEWLTGVYYQRTLLARGNDGNSPIFTLGAATPYIPLPAATNPAAATTCGHLLCLGKPGDQGFENAKSRSAYEALFAQGTYHFSDQFALTLGGRGQTEEKHASLINADIISPTEPLGLDLLTASLTPTSVNTAFDHKTSMFTWTGTGEYHPNHDTMVYVTVSRGGKSFGYNIGFGNAPTASRPFKDEYVYNYEAGVKTSLFEGRARLQASAFRADYHNYQNAGFIGLQFLVDNAERMSVTGGEASGTFAFGHGLTGNASITYVNAEYNKYTYGSCYYGEAPNNFNHSACDLSHQNVPLVPHWRSNAGLQYARSVSIGNVYSRIDWSWQSSDLTNTNLDPRSLQPAYSLVNARLGFKTNNGFDVSVWANNLTNQTYSMADAVTNLFGTADPAFQRFLGRPREFGLTMRKSF